MQIPPVLRSNRLLATLNGLAVASAMGALAGAGAGLVFRDFDKSGLATLCATFVLGAIWAAILRVRTTVGPAKVRLGWLLSLPLAALNGVVAEMIFASLDRSDPALWRAAWHGLVYDAPYWIAGLGIVLVLFGVPLAWSQRQAEKGLSGRERGEAMVGAVSALLGACAWAIMARASSESTSVLALRLASMAALGLGLCTSVAALVTSALRRRFVADVEAGKIARFRVDPTPEGKVLVRVTPNGESYRVGDFEEEIAKLDAEGEVVQSRER